MRLDFWLSANPEDYARRFPAWYWLYFEFAERRISRGKVCSALSVEAEFLDECERVPATIHPKAGAYDLLDTVALAVIAQARQDSLPYKFLIRHVLNWRSLAWQAIVGAIQKKDIWIAVLPEKNAYYGPYFVDGNQHPLDGTPINLGKSIRRILLEMRWPRLCIEDSKIGNWKIKVEGSGYLLLEALPMEGDTLPWPQRIEGADMEAYRKLSASNILEVDPIYRATPMWSENPNELKANIAESIDELLAINLDAQVPMELQQMFEVLKGSLAYGHFYRPLTTFAASQVHFIEDAALYHRCKQDGIAPPKIFHKRIEVLLRKGIIPPYEAFVWHAKRDLRNSVAHRTHQWLMWPGMDFSSVEIAALDINRLFKPIFAQSIR